MHKYKITKIYFNKEKLRTLWWQIHTIRYKNIQGGDYLKAINLTFKNNKEEIELYEWICSHTNKSCFIKDILMKVKNDEEKSSKKIMKGFLRLE